MLLLPRRPRDAAFSLLCSNSVLRPVKLVSVVICIIVIVLLESACGWIPGKGACHRANGDRVTHLYDYKGAKWPVSRVDIESSGGHETYCGVSLEASFFIGSRSFFYHRGGGYLTDESGESMFHVYAESNGMALIWPVPHALNPTWDGLQWY